MTSSNSNSSDELVVSLTDASVGSDRVSPSRVGGKASSLAKLFATEGLGSRVPKAHALTVDFFAPWVDQLVARPAFAELTRALANDDATAATALCAELQAQSLGLAVSQAQSSVVAGLATALEGSLAAVRSSAPEEDGSGASFAGAFETKLAVATTPEGLTEAIKACFASLWDYRVLLYKQKQHNSDPSQNIGFCVVVMEMVDSVVAGVAFSANPLNSDRDEIVIDSSWGLGESVVDGSVTADRYTVDKLDGFAVLEEAIGTKGTEKRLGGVGEGVIHKDIDETDPRYSQSSLSHEQIKTLSELVCLIEETYGMPMDVEWAFVFDDDTDVLKPKLLQARPITTLYTVDPGMMSKPGEKRLLYMDFNIFSEATTTSPFTTLDMALYNKIFFSAGFGFSIDGTSPIEDYFNNWTDPHKMVISGATREYLNMGYVFQWASQETLAEACEMMDPYLASIIRSKDFSPQKYKTSNWFPKGIWKLGWSAVRHQYNMFRMAQKYTDDPKRSKEGFIKDRNVHMENFHRVANEDFDFRDGLLAYTVRLYDAIMPTIALSAAVIMWVVMPVFNEVDEQRRNGKTDEIKEEYEALLGGFEGDPLMEINIALHRLASKFPAALWGEYKGEHGLTDLAERIREERDLPEEFLLEWKSFMDTFGFDGPDQVFVGCPRYQDNPESLLQILRLNSMGGKSKDPSVVAKELLEKRRAVMTKQLDKAKQEADENSSFWTKRALKKEVARIQGRNEILDNLFWIRNQPKIDLTVCVAAIRTKVLEIGEKLAAEGRLEKKGDIFHLKFQEIDQALMPADGTASEVDLMELVRPRRAVHERAVASNVCPILVDSRCRILKADPPKQSNEPGTLVGAAISPGVAIGKVKIIKDLSPEQTKGFGVDANGEKENHVLCAVVTGPAWTPLFASACAIVLQLGGVLQHGALCAREYGKPAVSNIDVYALLKDGMTVSVDGNTGIVKILKDEHGNDV